MKRADRTKVKLLKMTRRNTARCIFCGASPTTQEHVFSQWTQKYMLPRRAGKAASYIAVEYADKVESANLKMAGELRDWQIKCVCASCNNGWMSQLDTAAEPVMKPLILRKRERLSAKDCRIIATWSVLKSMVVHHRIVHHLRRKKLKTDCKPPKGWSVWIANSKRGKWKSEWLSRLRASTGEIPRKTESACACYAGIIDLY